MSMVFVIRTMGPSYTLRGERAPVEALPSILSESVREAWPSSARGTSACVSLTGYESLRRVFARDLKMSPAAYHRHNPYMPV
jgi:hypothetical protein